MAKQPPSCESLTMKVFVRLLSLLSMLLVFSEIQLNCDLCQLVLSAEVC